MKHIKNIDSSRIELSILNQSQAKTENLLKKIDIEYLHIDIMDGYFVKELSNITPFFLKQLNTEKYKLHLHFMVEDVVQFFEYYSFLENIASVSFHVESSIFQDTQKYNMFIKTLLQRNIEIGLVLNPETSIDTLQYQSLKYIDFIMLMSVSPGKGGQSFLKTTKERIFFLHKNFEQKILLDGGVNEEIYSQFESKVKRFIMGSYLYKLFS